MPPAAVLTRQTTSGVERDQTLARLKQVRPASLNPINLIRPKVTHPTPYFRSDSHRNKPLFREQPEEPIVSLQGQAAAAPPPPHPQLMPPFSQHSPVALTTRRQSPVTHVQRHSPVPLMPDPSALPPPCLEYVYGNHQNYHDYMVRSGRIPVNVSHSNLIGQPVGPVYSPYDQPYVPYRNEMERISQPYIDPYISHNLHLYPPNQRLDCLPVRPANPGFYRYLAPHSQHVHPMWIYPHMLER